jgi:hypothetical protein
MIMKNLLKFIALALCLLPFITSCGESGGTIIVKNTYDTDEIVTVYSDFSHEWGDVFSYNEKYGPKTIIAGSSENFDVDGNTEYGIVWEGVYEDKYRTVSVSDGNTVEVTIP